MKKRRQTLHSRHVTSTSLYLGPMQWSIVEYYQRVSQHTLSDTIRGMLTLFAEGDEEMDPKTFWNDGVMRAYERFADDPKLQADIIRQALRWLKRVHQWEPPAKDIPKFPDNA